GGVLGLVAQEAAQLRNCLIDRPWSDDDAVPDLIEQPMYVHDLSGMGGQVQQHPHGAGLELMYFRPARDFIGGRVDTPRTDAQDPTAESDWDCPVHGRARLFSKFSLVRRTARKTVVNTTDLRLRGPPWPRGRTSTGHFFHSSPAGPCACMRATA